MKNKTLFLLLITIPYFSYTQTAPEIEWQNTIGGGSTEKLYSLEQTDDGGYILGGNSGSNYSIDKTENNIGYMDFWVIKLNSIGEIEWENTIGGTEEDFLTSIQQTTDSGYILGGWSTSGISGDKTEENIGDFDFWVLKLDGMGNIVWQHTIGGNATDKLQSVVQTADGGYILGGWSDSEISGDKSESSHGSFDYWVVKLDAFGNIEWQNTIGGDDADVLYTIIQTSDAGYLLGGYSQSIISGDKTESCFFKPSGIRSDDYWVIKIDPFGNVEWQNVIGGNLDDNQYTSVEILSGYAVGGSSLSGITGDKIAENFGSDDYWVLESNSLGEIQWQVSIGGDSEDDLYSITKAYNNGYIISGFSLSGLTGNKTEPNLGYNDYWIVRLDSNGYILWQNTIGGNESDKAYVIIQTSDGGYLLGGESASNISGDKTENNIGNGDIWIIKFFPECIPSVYYFDEDTDGYGNNALSILSCDTPSAYVLNSLDCNDLNDLINPGMDEICNSIDDNCNFLNDEDLPLYDYYFDADLDGYGNNAIVISHCYDTIPTGYVTDNSDCDDFNHLVFEPLIYYADMDGDFYGDSLNTTYFCGTIPPVGFVTNNLDCDDTNAFINPGSNEIENGMDDNCNDTIDEGFDAILQNDLLSFSIFPNPNNGNFTITFHDKNSSFISIEIFNSLGEKIYSGKLISNNIMQIKLPETFSGLANMIIKTDYAIMNKTIFIIK